MSLPFAAATLAVTAPLSWLTSSSEREDRRPLARPGCPEAATALRARSGPFGPRWSTPSRWLEHPRQPGELRPLRSSGALHLRHLRTQVRARSSAARPGRSVRRTGPASPSSQSSPAVAPRDRASCRRRPCRGSRGWPRGLRRRGRGRHRARLGLATNALPHGRRQRWQGVAVAFSSPPGSSRSG